MTIDRLVSRPQLGELFGIKYSNVHLHRLEKTGKFPRRVRLSLNRVGWKASEIQAWIEARAAERDNTPAAA